MTPQELLECARQARTRAYCPYSHFAVGAALLTESGRVYLGCNIECASYSPSVCAERTAFAKAVSEGAEAFAAIAVAGGPAEDSQAAQPCMPCGVCRQFMREFCDGDFRVITSDGGEDAAIHTLDQLLPEAFGPAKGRGNSYADG